jgi:hypothetical protein
VLHASLPLGMPCNLADSAWWLLQAALCDNLLAANWAPQQLPNVIILGNSFSHYAERFSMRGTNPNTKRPEKMLQLLKAGWCRLA